MRGQIKSLKRKLGSHASDGKRSSSYQPEYEDRHYASSSRSHR